MPKAFRLVPFLFIIALPASAQLGWLKKKHIVRPDLPRPIGLMANDIVISPAKNPKMVADVNFGITPYCYEQTEAAMLKTLYHTLRFHMNAESIANYRVLIDLYISECHYSEAKWHLLQCNLLAQKTGDTNAIIYTLISLGTIKTQLCEYTQAREDLLLARGLCLQLGRLADVAGIDKKLDNLKARELLNAKTETRYAVVADDKKTQQ